MHYTAHSPLTWLTGERVIISPNLLTNTTDNLECQTLRFWSNYCFKERAIEGDIFGSILLGEMFRPKIYLVDFLVTQILRQFLMLWANFKVKSIVLLSVLFMIWVFNGPKP